MKIVNPALFGRMHQRIRRCQWCRAAHCQPLQVHHHGGRGMGGGKRLDVGFLCLMLGAPCHRGQQEHREPTDAQVLGKLAALNRCTVGDVEAARDWLLKADDKFRLHPEIWAEQFVKEMDGLPPEAARLVKEALAESAQ